MRGLLGEHRVIAFSVNSTNSATIAMLVLLTSLLRWNRRLRSASMKAAKLVRMSSVRRLPRPWLTACW
jgi:hypothetical protein